MEISRSGASGKLRRFAEFAVESCATHGLRGTATLMTRMAIGRARLGFGLDEFLVFDLANRARASWPEYVREEANNAAMLRILHPPPARLARDKVLALERATEKGVAMTPVLAVVGRDGIFAA
jgi:hypothetical protein